MEPSPLNYFRPSTQLAVGVRGFTFLRYGYIVIPYIVAERPGNGDVGRFLDRLSCRCMFIEVKSERLQGMLVRRGWKKAMFDGIDRWTTTTHTHVI